MDAKLDVLANYKMRLFELKMSDGKMNKFAKKYGPTFLLITLVMIFIWVQLRPTILSTFASLFDSEKANLITQPTNNQPAKPVSEEKEVILKNSTGVWVLEAIDSFSESNINDNILNIVNRINNYNNELQSYLPENVEIQDGEIHLIAKEERYEDRLYTSGSLNTKDKISIKYGRVEVKAKTPTGKGLRHLWQG